jgi:hypothetical protein
MRKQNYSISLPQIDDLQEIKVMLADRREEWAHGYITEGAIFTLIIAIVCVSELFLNKIPLEYLVIMNVALNVFCVPNL